MADRLVCAISGSSGYVGGCLKNYLAAHGREILELIRRPVRGTRAVSFQLGDEVSPGALAGVDALVHCAYDFQPLRRHEIRAVNVDGTRKLFQAARTAGVGKLVCLSSISAFDGCRSLYGQAKLEIEKIAHEFGALIVRPGLVYGDGSGGMFGRLVAQVRKSSVIPLAGDGMQIQFLVHQEDLAGFIEKWIGQPTPITPRLLSAAHDRPWPFRELLTEIARGLNKQVKFICVPWRLVWAGLKSAESVGLQLNFRSDSVVSLMHQNPNPDFSSNAATGLICRPFEAQKLRL